MVADLHGALWARRRGKPSVSFKPVKRRLDHRPYGGGQKTDNRDCSYEYTGCIPVPRFIELEKHSSGSGSLVPRSSTCERVRGDYKPVVRDRKEDNERVAWFFGSL